MLYLVYTQSWSNTKFSILIGYSTMDHYVTDNVGKKDGGNLQKYLSLKSQKDYEIESEDV